MEGTYFNNPTFPLAEDLNTMEDREIPDKNNNYEEDYREQSVKENVNSSVNTMLIDKSAKIYVSFKDSMNIRDKIITGKIKEIGKNYLIVHTIDYGYIIKKDNINYIEFKP